MQPIAQSVDALQHFVGGRFDLALIKRIPSIQQGRPVKIDIGQTRRQSIGRQAKRASRQQGHPAVIKQTFAKLTVSDDAAVSQRFGKGTEIEQKIKSTLRRMRAQTPLDQGRMDGLADGRQNLTLASQIAMQFSIQFIRA